MTESRIVTGAEAREAVARWRASGLRVGILAGDFDLLGVGHARALAAARASADRIVIAVREDAEVAARRGEGRPVLEAAERARLAAALRGVDRVVVAGRGERAQLAGGGTPSDLDHDLPDPVDRVRARGEGTR